MQITDTKIVSIPLAQLVCNDGQIEGVPANPRILRDEKYRALVASLRADNLTGINPLKVIRKGDKFEYIVLGGNMRLRALQEIGATECPCIEIPQATPTEVLRKIVVLDNSTFGEWDWDVLANEWDDAELKEWGLDVWKNEDINKILDDADFESLTEKARGKVQKEQFTFLFDNADALIVNAYIKEHGKDELQTKIVEICQEQEVK